MEHPTHSGYFQNPDMPWLWLNAHGKCINDISAGGTIPLSEKIATRYAELEQLSPNTYNEAKEATIEGTYRTTGSTSKWYVDTAGDWPLMRYIYPKVTSTDPDKYGWVIKKKV